ncbi:MAG: hypothetical protein EOP78_04405 [Variovorax sp.]|nr:MAG: hypothetical protein EOP78_04405 [Variovorax sp.]
MIPRSDLLQTAHIAAAVLAVAALAACDGKTSPPRPAAKAGEGPTAASGGPPSNSYPAGIKPASSGVPVAAAASDHKGPAEGGTAIGGVSAGQAADATPGGGATAPTGGDGRPAPK